MAKQRAKRYRSRTEAERDRPRLSRDNPVSLKEFVDLVGDYEFPKAEYVRCQLVDDTGKCHQLHGSGWIAQLMDESEGYIGHDCAEGHFATNPRFASLFTAAAERVSREITIGQLVAALTTVLANPGLSEALNDLKRRWDLIHNRAMNLQARLTDPLRKELTARRKAGNANVMIRVHYVETEIDAQGREHKLVRHQPVRWGALSGLQALDPRPLSKIGQRLNDAKSALEKAVASEDQPQKQLGKWVADLEYIERAEEDLRQYETSLEAFCRPENLKLLWLLLQGRFEQRAAIRVAIDIASRRQVSDTEVDAARDAWVQEIKAAQGGRDFDVVG